MRFFHSCIADFALILSLSVASAQAPAGPEQPSKQPVRSSAARVVVKEGALTAKVQNASLRGLVQEIASQAEIAIEFDPLAPDQSVSVNYEGLPVETALPQLLKDFDVFYYFGVGDKPPARLQIVWVYPKTVGRGLKPVSNGEGPLGSSLWDPASVTWALLSWRAEERQ